MSIISEPLVPRTRAYVPLREIDVKYIIGDSKLTYEQVIQFIQKTMNDAMDVTIEECEQWIDTYVPKRSGDLIESLKSFLKKSKLPPTFFKELRNLRLILGVGAEIKYAKYVREMTDQQVQHFGTWFEHSGKRAYSKGKPVYLDDPHAKGKYFDALAEYAIDRLKMNLSKISWVTIRV